MLSEETVRGLAQSAQISLTKEETVALTEDLNSVLSEISNLEKLATEDIEPLVRPLTTTNVTRADEVQNLLTQQEALLNAPEAESGMFKVSSILGGEM